jgi:hypothetical protein
MQYKVPQYSQVLYECHEFFDEWFESSQIRSLLHWVIIKFCKESFVIKFCDKPVKQYKGVSEIKL